MNPGTKLLRAVALMSTGLALTACGGPMTEEEAASMEANTMATSANELGSCAGWSEWYNTGNTSCGSTTTCGYVWSCDYYGLKTGDSRSAMDVQAQMYYCDDGSPAYRVYNPATFAEQYSYRVCFDQYGNYTHTEYQYQNAKSACGC